MGKKKKKSALYLVKGENSWKTTIEFSDRTEKTRKGGYVRSGGGTGTQMTRLGLRDSIMASEKR